MRTKTVYIATGYAEGGWHINKFKKPLTKHGLLITKDPHQADIIITHSAGCYFVPRNTKPHLIMLIGPPYWPGKSIIRRILHNIVLDAPAQIKDWGAGNWLHKKLWNLCYILNPPWHSVKVSKSLKKDLVELFKDKKIIIVRNQRDPFCSPEAKRLADEHENVSFFEIPGLHDDCWFNPQKYIDLLLKEL